MRKLAGFHHFKSNRRKSWCNNSPVNKSGFLPQLLKFCVFLYCEKSALSCVCFLKMQHLYQSAADLQKNWWKIWVWNSFRRKKNFPASPHSFKNKQGFKNPLVPSFFVPLVPDCVFGSENRSFYDLKTVVSLK